MLLLYLQWIWKITARRRDAGYQDSRKGHSFHPEEGEVTRAEIDLEVLPLLKKEIEKDEVSLQGPQQCWIQRGLKISTMQGYLCAMREDHIVMGYGEGQPGHIEGQVQH